MIRYDYSRFKEVEVREFVTRHRRVRSCLDGPKCEIRACRLGAAKSRNGWASSEKWMLLQLPNARTILLSRQAFLSFHFAVGDLFRFGVDGG